MEGDSNSQGSLGIDWNTDDELEVQNSVSTNFEIGEEGDSNREGSLGIDWDTDDELEVQNSVASSNYVPRQVSANFEIGEEGDSNSQGSLGIDWDTDDELEVQNSVDSSNFVPRQVSANFEIGEGSSSGSSRSKIQQFTIMGFSKDKVERAIDENGTDNDEAILDALQTYDAIENLPPDEEPVLDNPHASSSGDNFLNVSSDEENCYRGENSSYDPTDKDNTFSVLVDMGFKAEDVKIAIERYGLDTSIADLSDFLFAAQIAKKADLILQDDPREETRCSSSHPRPRNAFPAAKRHKKAQKNKINYDDGILYKIPKPMKGFSIPGEEIRVSNRTIPYAARGPPYFYYENIALTPKGVWKTISRILYNIIPEYVDSKYFCAAARKRGYIHNLPIKKRFPILPIPKRTIHEVFPETKKWWPKWDERTQLNCLLTCIGSAKLTNRIKERLDSEIEPSEANKKYAMEQCRKWNLIWVGKNKVAPLEPEEIEKIMGFPKNHTRGCSRTDRYTGLGNSFQIDTVAYHLSVLKELYSHGMNVLSLFSGIGGAEVALDRLGIHLKNVVSVEKSESCNIILQSWWDQTKQTGNLIHIPDVKIVTPEILRKFINEFGGFDLIIGGSPCNNLAGGNRVSRDGLNGEHSSLFYDYFRILNQVTTLMKK